MGVGGGAAGGGALHNIGTLTIKRSLFHLNRAVYGGGINNSGSGILTVGNTTFSGNLSENNGGGINNSGTATVVNPRSPAMPTRTATSAQPAALTAVPAAA